MTTTDMTAVLDILRVLYKYTQTMEEFADSVVFREGQKAVLVEDSDSDRLKTFVENIFVCFDKKLLQVASCRQVRPMFRAELVSRTLLRLSLVAQCICAKRLPINC